MEDARWRMHKESHETKQRPPPYAQWQTGGHKKDAQRDFHQTPREGPMEQTEGCTRDLNHTASDGPVG